MKQLPPEFEQYRSLYSQQPEYFRNLVREDNALMPYFISVTKTAASRFMHGCSFETKAPTAMEFSYNQLACVLLGKLEQQC
jgi:hypothetical protein